MITGGPSRLVRSFLYGGGSALLTLDIFFLLRAAFTSDFVPLLPILAGVLTAVGLLLIVYAEQQAREEDKRNHRRISRVAHQLTSPLKAMQDDLERLLRHADKLPAEERLGLKRLQTKSAILMDNVRDVFLTLQAQEGGIAQDVRVYDLCALVKEGIRRSQTLASAHNVELTYKTHCPHAPVRVDRRLFLIMLAHLIENAILYTVTPGLVNVAVIKSTNRARVIIQDRGIGISKSDAQHVWQPFARGASAEQHDPDGIGVGLALSRLIVREFAGSLTWQKRERALGSQFEIALPLQTVGAIDGN